MYNREMYDVQKVESIAIKIESKKRVRVDKRY